MVPAKKDQYVLWFHEIDKDDLPFVGGKGANLGEMTKIKIPVPQGFVVTVKAYFDFLDANHLREPIKDVLRKVDVDDSQSLDEASVAIKTLIKKSRVPEEIGLAIMKAYLKMGKGLRQPLVAARSSATAEDLPTASFAGQQATYLNVQGEANVVNRVRDCWASLFESRAIFYREQNNFDHFKVGIAVPVQEMVQSVSSGVMFTSDPVTGEKNKILIEGIFGLGELIVRGEVIPDRYIVNRQSFIMENKVIGQQTVKMVKKGRINKKIRLSVKEGQKQKITDRQVIALAKLGAKLHKHYYFPQDIEWAVVGQKLYILQTRPITTLGKKEETETKINLPIILKGSSASPGIGSGPVRIIRSPRELERVKKGDILVTTMTTPDFVPAMKKVTGIITDQGGQTSHAAIVSRELGVACVIGTTTATKKLKDGQIVTVNGKTGFVHEGALKWESKKLGDAPQVSQSMVKTATRIYVNLAEPEMAEKVAALNVDGVGLMRAEFIMAQFGIHPRKAIEDKKSKDFVNQLAEGMAKFCRAFEPRPVVYRASDFKTNEYRNLKGGARYEPEEENPLIGFRGAYRYISDPDVFELELRAIKKVRNQMGFKNLWLMLPFVRTPEELVAVKRIIVANGLSRTPSFKLWLMVEIPSNVILLEEFIKVGIDGVSIGSNDLTMLILGTDRDNAELKSTFDERHPAVMWALEKTITTCHKEGITCSICGQAPSFYGDLVQKLVEWGITSISVSPDVIDNTRELVYFAEDKLIKKRG